ncbi:MAG: hypothetical protein JWR18_2468 [Segetibacter sp.]|nr:hypothetical protein [Segetibacter sp.]
MFIPTSDFKIDAGGTNEFTFTLDTALKDVRVFHM